MNTTRTIIHSDGHTDIETYIKDADGVWVWAVTQCNGGDMARTLNGNLTGKAAHRSIDDFMSNEPSLLTDEDRARIKHNVELGYHKNMAHFWAQQVNVDVDKFLLAMDFIRLQETHDWKSEANALEADAKDWKDQVTDLRAGG